MPMTWPQVYRQCESQRVERANTTVKIKTLRLGVSGRPKVPTAAAAALRVLSTPYSEPHIPSTFWDAGNLIAADIYYLLDGIEV